MDTPDRTDGALSPWTPPKTAPAPVPTWEPPDESAAPAPRPLDLRTAWRAVRRHWWQILLLWAVLSAGAVALIRAKVRPKYESFALLKLEPKTRNILVQGGGENFAPFIETQVFLVTSPGVLTLALQDRAVQGTRLVREAPDPEKELRDQIQVFAQPRTHIIRVSLTAEDPAEAATIVNAVVDAYLKVSTTWVDEEIRTQLNRLAETKQQFERDVDRYRDQLRTLTLPRAAAGDAKDRPTADEYRRYKEQLADVKIQLRSAEAVLRLLQRQQSLTSRPAAGGAPSEEALEEAILDRFQAAPAVVSAADDIKDLNAKIKEAARRTRNKFTDPTLVRLRTLLDEAHARYNGLWAEMYPRLRQDLTRQPVGTDPAAVAVENEIQAQRKEVAQLKAREDSIQDYLERVGDVGDDAELKKQFASHDLEYATKMLVAVSTHLADLEQQARGDAHKAKSMARAVPARAPLSHTRTKLMAAAPAGLLVLVLGLFLVVEVRAGRVADPDDLPARLRLGVIGVVPPLPGARPARSPRALRDERRRVEEFVQSLDHLRVTLCAPRPGRDARRCVLITSAIGGEGKTTLAAQLAGRCANAGLLTLLIDADLRRPSLGDLLEVPEGPGLADVLAGEAEPEAAMVVIGNAGGFHLLPAGTPGHDPSRLLQGDRLGQLVAQFRATFDIVIVDAPPVLAVPDALLLGRWTDGAIVAVRHDTSRFPLVERANRRLAAVGIPVLGAVVNGVRTVETAYGSYQYDGYTSRSAPAHDPAPAGDQAPAE